ncbi:hypothetical protein ElyMa_000066200 [Elysia marginata]|uniref:Uncharacterized protein n=1 Tax=Elysia marginata TaxID=1093978 RepID=A0AAV4EGZ9_9GAST|nr:hypothetical protein ElyMa_000066200 [Elysia marginata]
MTYLTYPLLASGLSELVASANLVILHVNVLYFRSCANSLMGLPLLSRPTVMPRQLLGSSSPVFSSSVCSGQWTSGVQDLLDLLDV